MAGWISAVKVRPRLNLSLSILIGMLFGAGTAGYWAQANSGFTVEVLGAGKRVSVLISHDQRQILIASGTNGPEFSNALDSATSTFANDIDLILIDMSSTDDVIERARALDAELFHDLPNPDRESPSTLSESMIIPLSNTDTVTIEVDQAESWQATIASDSGTIQIRSESTTDPASEALVISVDGQNLPAVDPLSVVIGPPGDWEQTVPLHASVPAGEVSRIDIAGDQLRVD